VAGLLSIEVIGHVLHTAPEGVPSSAERAELYE
jgi:hypothetical protein